MLSRSLPLLLLLGSAALGACRPGGGAGARELRVCSEEENMPFSNARAEGFEDKIALLFAQDVGARVQHVTLPAGAVLDKRAIEANACDVVVGVPRRLALMPATRPYYRAGWVFVTRSTSGEPIRSFDDPRLSTLRVGVPVVGGHGAELAPVQALARRGIVTNVRKFPVYVDDPADPAPLAELRALAAGDIDVAVVWGPHAGWFVDDRTKVSIAKVEPEVDHGVPLAYDVAIGARDDALRDELDGFLARRADDVEALVRTYGVPR